MSKLDDRSNRRDRFHKKAKKLGFLARAVFKLEELDQQFKLFKPGQRVLDLGCSPGSWLQYARSKVGKEGILVGLDRGPLRGDTSGSRVVVGDVMKVELPELLGDLTAFDVVLSDMAPKTIGDSTTDALRSEALFERALEFASVVLRPGGHFAGKVFQGGGFTGLMERVRGLFLQSKPFHTKATRAGSAEHYLVGQGRRPTPAA